MRGAEVASSLPVRGAPYEPLWLSHIIPEPGRAKSERAIVPTVSNSGASWESRLPLGLGESLSALSRDPGGGIWRWLMSEEYGCVLFRGIGLKMGCGRGFLLY